MSSISFDNAYLLLIAPLLIVLFTVPFALAVKKDNRNGHNVTSFVLHIVMAIIIAFAAAGTNLTTILTETDVYVVADVSYSARNKADLIDQHIKNLELPRKSKLGLVCFGKGYEVVSDLDNPKKVASVKKAKVDNTESDISGALTYTASLFKTGVMKRIVLITDGRQSDLSSNNTIRRTVDGLAAQNIKVDAIFLDDNLSSDAKEVQISGVEYTEYVHIDSDQTARVAIQTSYNTSAEITLKRDGEVVNLERQYLTLGSNSISFKLDTSAVGTFEYEVSISVESDEIDCNNVYYFSQTVSDEMRVLVLTQKWEDCVALVRLYGGKGYLDVYENTGTATATKNNFINQYSNYENITINTNNSETMRVPFTVEELSRYDEIVLSNIDLSTLDFATQFVTSLDTVVSDYGKSLVTLGDLKVQNREDDDFKQLVDMLPVKMGNSDDDPKLYTFVIDDSRSMYFLYHLQTAKTLVTRLLNLLNDSDYVTIIKIDSQAEVVYNAKPLTEREEIIETVENFEVANGTVIGKGLESAYQTIRYSDFYEKQIMLITDGLTYGNDRDPVEMAQIMYEESEIITSVFDVGRQGETVGSNGQVNSNADPEEDAIMSAAREMLKNIAAEGHGNYYYSNNVEHIDDVAFGEVADDLTASVVEEPTAVTVKLPRDTVLAGIDIEVLDAMPNVLGYVYSRIKPSAKTVLTVNHAQASGNTVEKPLLAYWNYGNGKVSTFTSNLTNWTDNWQTSLKETLFDNLYNEGVPKIKQNVPYTVSLIDEGKITRIELHLTSIRINHSATVTITSPNGGTLVGNMTYNGNIFYYELETADLGKYSLDITYTYSNNDYKVQRAVYVSYLDEYDAFAVYEPSELHTAIDGRGTVIDSDDETLKIENDPDEMGRYVFEFTVPFLIVAAVLFVADIVIRKLKWDDIKSLFGYGKSKEVKK